MKFEECYRGFIWADMEKFYNEEKQRPDKRIKTFMGKDKNGNDKEFSKMESYRQKKKLKTFDQVSDIPNGYNSIVGVLAPDIVLIDVDNAEQGEKLWEILTDMGIDCPVIETTKGYHFLFRDIYGYGKSENKFYTPIGIEIDIKLGNNGGLEFLTVAGEERKILNDTENIPDLPIFLYSKGKFEQIKEIVETEGADTRNNFMNSHNWHLQSLGYTFEESLEICTIIDTYIFYEPLPEEEFKRTVRDLKLKLNDGLYSDNTPLDKVTAGMFFNEKGKFFHHLFGEYLARRYYPIKIDEILYIYDSAEGIYTKDTTILKKAMLDIIPDLKINNKREALDVFNTLAEKKEIDYRYRAVGNGILDTKEFKLLEFTPNIVCTSKIPTCYNSEAPAGKTDKIISSFVCGDQYMKNLIYEMLGYSLFKDKNLIGKFFIIVGNKENGKSVFLRYVTGTFGNENIMSLDLKDLGSRFATTLMKDKIFNLGDDISSNYIDETDILKKVVTGENMFVEEKGKQGKSESYNITLIFTANKIPRVKDPTGAVLRRAMILMFTNNFSVGSPERDERILEKIRGTEEKEGLLRLAIEGLKRLSERGYFEENEEIRKNLMEFDLDNNPIKAFDLDLKLSQSDNWYIGKSTKEVYRQYEFWCIENDVRPLSRRNFTTDFKSLNNVEIRKKKIDGYPENIYYEEETLLS
jgi:poxvirus D5 protein-like